MVKKRKYSALQYTYNRMNNGQIKGALLFSDVAQRQPQAKTA